MTRPIGSSQLTIRRATEREMWTRVEHAHWIKDAIINQPLIPALLYNYLLTCLQTSCTAFSGGCCCTLVQLWADDKSNGELTLCVRWNLIRLGKLYRSSSSEWSGRRYLRYQSAPLLLNAPLPLLSIYFIERLWRDCSCQGSILAVWDYDTPALNVR